MRKALTTQTRSSAAVGDNMPIVLFLKLHKRLTYTVKSRFNKVCDLILSRLRALDSLYVFATGRYTVIATLLSYVEVNGVIGHESTARRAPLSDACVPCSGLKVSASLELRVQTVD